MSSSIDIIIKATDEASKVLAGVSKNVSNVSVSMQDSLKALATTAAAVGAAIVAIGTGATKLAMDAASGLDIQRGFVRSYGEDMENNLIRLRGASQRTISDVDLMATANRASLLGVTSSIEDLSKLMVTARLRGKEMGLSTTQAFNDIVTGIGRGSPLILDNLGIKIPDAIKEQMESMDQAQKTQLLLNFAMEDGAAIAAQLGGDLATPSDMFAKIKADAENFAFTLGKSVLPHVMWVIDAISLLSNGLTFFVTTGDAGNDMLYELAQKLGISDENFKKIASQLERARTGVIKFISSLKPFVEEYGPIVKNVLRDIGTFLIDHIQPILIALGALILAVVVPAFVAWVASLLPVTLAIGAIVAAVIFFSDVWKQHGDEILAKAQEIWVGITEVLNVIVAAFNSVVETLRPYVEDIVEIVTLGWEAMMLQTDKLLAYFNDNIKPVLDIVVKFFVENFGYILDFMSTWGQLIVLSFSQAWNLLTGIVKTALQIFTGDWKAAWETIKDTAVSLFSGIGQGIGLVFDGVVQSLKIGLNAVISVVNGAIQKINSTISSIEEKVGVDVGFNIPEIPMLARGTDSFRGGMAIVGEEGPELVNLPRGSRVAPAGETAQAMGATINNTFNNVDIDASELSRLLMFQLQTT